jgi:hypothetical protein
MRSLRHQILRHRPRLTAHQMDYGVGKQFDKQRTKEHEVGKQFDKEDRFIYMLLYLQLLSTYTQYRG